MKIVKALKIMNTRKPMKLLKPATRAFYEFGLNIRYASGRVVHMGAIGHESCCVNLIGAFLSPEFPYLLDEPVSGSRPYTPTFLWNGAVLEGSRTFAHYGITNLDTLDVVWC